VLKAGGFRQCFTAFVHIVFRRSSPGPRKKAKKPNKSEVHHNPLWSASCLQCTHPEVLGDQPDTQIRIPRRRAYTHSILLYQKQGFCKQCTQPRTTIACGQPDFFDQVPHRAAASSMPALYTWIRASRGEPARLCLSVRSIHLARFTHLRLGPGRESRSVEANCQESGGALPLTLDR